VGGRGGKGGSREKWGEMTQTLYAHINIIKRERKSDKGSYSPVLS
jgi:hypothetical protein